MTPLLVAILSMPCVYWTQGVESRAELESAGVTQICVPAANADAWRAAGFAATPIMDGDLASREKAASPGIAPRAGVASPTRSPWIDANGWRFARKPAVKYAYDVAAGRGALATAEAFAYGADAVLKIDPADLAKVGEMQKFIQGISPADLPAVADLAVVDDGSPVTGEVINLLSRRNLLFKVVPSPDAKFRVNVAMGTAAYPLAEAADPNAFALKIRRQLTDEQRSLRLYGSEVVIARFTADPGRARLHLLNYAGRDIEGLRVRLRGAFAKGDAQVAGAGRVPLDDFAVADGWTEFSLPRLATYAVIDLAVSR
jgi:hypothetical protein